jgi:predicted DNA-binding protein
MSPQKGRPTDDPKNLNTRIRLSENDVEKLDYCSKKLGIKKSEIIRMGIDKVYKEMKK